MTIHERNTVECNADSFSVTNLSFSYKDRSLYENTSIEMPRGGITGLIGPNGCGKTTLINLLVRSLPEGDGPGRLQQRDVVLMSQEFTMPNLITVEECVGLILHLNKAPFSSTDELSETWSALERDNWRVIRGQLAGKCSLGERKWIYLRTIISLDRRFYMLDEPTAGVDPVYRLEIWKLLKRQSEMGKTFLVSSHLLDEIARFARPVYLVKDRKLLQFATGEVMQGTFGGNDMDQAFISALAG